MQQLSNAKEKNCKRSVWPPRKLRSEIQGSSPEMGVTVQ